MTSMFPGHGNRDRTDATPPGRPGPTDWNRARRDLDKQPAPGDVPGTLRWAYWLLLLAGILMFAAGLLGIFSGERFAGESATATQNRLFLSVTNAVAALVMGACAASTLKGSRRARGWLIGVVTVVLLINLAALALGMAGAGLLLIPLLLAVALLLLFRPETTAYFAAS